MVKCGEQRLASKRHEPLDTKLCNLDASQKVIPHVTPCKTILKLGNGTTISGGPGNSVGIATDYGLDGPGSNPGRDKIFRPSRPNQPAVKWVSGLSRG